MRELSKGNKTKVKKSLAHHEVQDNFKRQLQNEGVPGNDADAVKAGRETDHHVSLSMFQLRKYLTNYPFRARVDSLTLTIPQSTNKPLVWFDINSTFFSSYRIEGVDPNSPDDNVIYFELNATYLIAAFGNVKKSVESVEIKLSKEEFPFLSISMRAKASDDQEVDISNKVPCIIVPRLGWEDFELPYGPQPFDVECFCPRFLTFRKFIDTFKYSKNIRLVLRSDKTFVIEAATGPARHFTIFKNIKVENYGDQKDYEDAQPVSIVLEQKKVSQWLHSVSLSPVRLCCLIENNRQLKFYFRIRDDIIAHIVLAAEFDENDVSASEDEDEELFPSH